MGGLGGRTRRQRTSARRPAETRRVSAPLNLQGEDREVSPSERHAGSENDPDHGACHKRGQEQTRSVIDKTTWTSTRMLILFLSQGPEI